MRIVKGILIVVFLSLLAAPLSAVYVWDGQGGYFDYYFSSDINWDPDGAPPAAINDSIVFGPSAYAMAMNNMGTITGVQGISFNGNFSMVVNGSLSLDSGATIGGTATGNKTIYSALVTNGPGGIIINPDSFNLTLGSINEGAAGGSLTLASNITLTILGNNNFTGGVTMNAGTIKFNNSSSFGTGDITISGGNGTIQPNIPNMNVGNNISIENTRTLTVLATNNLTLSGDVSGMGALTKSGTSTLTLSGTNTHSGTTTISAGTLAVSGGSAIADTGAVSLANVASANFELLSNETIGSLAGGGTTGGNVNLNANTLTVGDASGTTYSGIISGTGTLAKQGTGALALSGNNTYSGGTTLNQGTIVLEHDNALGTGDLSVTGESILQSNDDARSTANEIGIESGATLTVSGTNNLALTGDISGNGAISKNDDSVLSLSGSNSYAGGTTLNAGTIIFGSDSALGAGALTIAANSSIQSNNDSRIISNLIDIAGSELTVDGSNNLRLSGAISGTGTLTKSGSSNLTLTGTNTYTGGTNVTEGTLTGDADSLQGDITNDSQVEFNQTTEGAYTGIMGGSGTLTKSGSGNLTLTGSNTYTGGTNVTAGILTGDTASLQGDIENDASVVFDQSFDGTFAGILSGTGTLNKTGAGSLTFSGGNICTGNIILSQGILNLGGQVCGDVEVNGGTLVGTGTIANGCCLTLKNGGRFAPGNSIGTTTISGNYTQESGSILEIEIIKEADSSLSNDLLDVTGSATLESGSAISVIDLTPTDRFIGTGDEFTIITADDGVTDNGTDITSASATLSFVGSVNGNDYILTATRNAFERFANSRNNAALLHAIDMDMGSASGDYIDLINELSALDATGLNTAAGQLNPISHASLNSFNSAMLGDMSSDLSGYLIARRANKEYLAQAQFNSLGSSDLLLADASENPDTLAYVITENERRRQLNEGVRQTNFFFRPFGVFFRHDSTPSFTGFEAQSAGSQFGFDRAFGTNWIIGIGGAYSHSHLDFHKGLGEADIDSFRAGPYATYYNGKFYIDGSFSLGYHINRAHREITALNRTAESRYDAYDLSAYIGGGYEFDIGKWILNPTLSTRYTCYRNESFKETEAGAAGMDVDAETQESLLSSVGIRLYTVTAVDTFKIVPEIFIGYAHEFMDEENIEARFIGGTTKFSTDVDSNRDDSIYYGAGLSGLLNKGTSAFIRYEGKSYSGSRSTALKIGLTLRF
ncbi:MAG: autotransporter domain-containing protein [Phycisphaerae bacterium]